MTFKIFINKGEDGKYIASVPSLPGCHSQGSTIDEAKSNVAEAAKGYLKVAKKFGDRISFDDTQTLETTLFIPAI
ncbi:MAG: hypothetical protein G01um10147_963 [Microgenomates group bacterium Gr01-1014_7]|nr:MAG: hypothetical protein G01um10147_963 [Microgenomates group bacterium Gr01-1014_7]